MIASETKTIQSRATALGLIAVVGTMLLSTLNASQAQTFVRDLDNPARQPFQAVVTDRSLPANRNRPSIPLTKVPPGKLLVVEHVSFKAQGMCRPPDFTTPAAASVLASLETLASADGTVGPQEHQLMVNKIVSSPPTCPRGTAFVVSQSIRVYVETGNQVSVRFESISERDNVALTRLAISGYFVDVP